MYLYKGKIDLIRKNCKKKKIKNRTNTVISMISVKILTLRAYRKSERY